MIMVDGDTLVGLTTLFKEDWTQPQEVLIKIIDIKLEATRLSLLEAIRSRLAKV